MSKLDRYALSLVILFIISFSLTLALRDLTNIAESEVKAGEAFYPSRYFTLKSEGRVSVSAGQCGENFAIRQGDHVFNGTETKLQPGTSCGQLPYYMSSNIELYSGRVEVEGHPQIVLPHPVPDVFYNKEPDIILVFMYVAVGLAALTAIISAIDMFKTKRRDKSVQP